MDFIKAVLGENLGHCMLENLLCKRLLLRATTLCIHGLWFLFEAVRMEIYTKTKVYF
jgi:hypothetical protein